MEAKLTRIVDNGIQTIGLLEVKSKIEGIVFKCRTLELAWRNNEKSKSCIPAGTYNIEKRYSKKYENHYIVNNVENRSYILIHAGNYNTDTTGCILVGNSFEYINSDKQLDLTKSKTTLDILIKLNINTLTIENL